MDNKTTFNARRFEQLGFARIAPLIDAGHCDALAVAFDAPSAKPRSAGLRHLIDHPTVHALLQNSAVATLMCEVLGGSAFAYKATLFDKNTEANWLVAWHQDISIPVRQKLVLDSWTGWSRKDGVLYAQPPPTILSKLVTLRINIDDCEDDNGPLRLRVGSHHLGRLPQSEIATSIDGHNEQAITGVRGSGLLMRPLLVHASSKATSPARRRVLHLEFANFALPGGMDWHRRIPVAATLRAADSPTTQTSAPPQP